MKTPSNQLDLFKDAPIDHSQLVTDKENGLLNLLNMDLKPNEKYNIEYFFQEDIFVVLVAANIHKHMICNAVDIYGNVPADFSVNWRSFPHIKQEIERETGKPMKL